MESTTVSRSGHEMIKTAEGFHSGTYRDAAGLPTVGYGHIPSRSHSRSHGVSDATKQGLLQNMEAQLKACLFLKFSRIREYLDNQIMETEDSFLRVGLLAAQLKILEVEKLIDDQYQDYVPHGSDDNFELIYCHDDELVYEPARSVGIQGFTRITLDTKTQTAFGTLANPNATLTNGERFSLGITRDLPWLRAMELIRG